MLKSFKKIMNIIFKKNIKEIKYFSSNGVHSIPNAHGIVKGGFFKDCLDNSKKFKSENYQYIFNRKYEFFNNITHRQYILSEYSGGILVFSTDMNNIKLFENGILYWFDKKIRTVVNKFFSKKELNIDYYIGAFSIGNFFSGRYIGDNGKVFDEKSLSIEINGISSKGLIYVAEEIAIDFDQETVLVKDLNKNKIFLVDRDKNGSYDLTNINSKSV